MSYYEELSPTVPLFDQVRPVWDSSGWISAMDHHVCAVCYEKFEVVWDHDEEEWMLKDAVLVDDKVYHPICQEDAGKEFKFGDDPDLGSKTESVEMTESKAEPTDSLSPENEPVKSEPEEHAFTCEDILSGTIIPGLSPPTESPQPEEEDDVDLKPDPDTLETSVPVQPESVLTSSQISKITADPLAALNAVLKGNLSSLTS